jgi:RNA polymerase sigma-70 factor (ECF subfamily)
MIFAGKVLFFQAAPGVEPSDEMLLDACAAGQHAALGTLFDRHHRSVYRFLCRYLGNGRPDLDDLVQTTFLEVMRAAGQFRRQGSVCAWILGIAANRARQHLRTEGRRHNLLSVLSREPSRDSARPDQSTENHEMLIHLEEALQALPHDLRTAFVMCDLEEISGVEAARVLGVPEGTLWRRLHDARKRLRNALKRDVP